MNSSPTFGEKVRQLRAQQRMTQRDLSLALQAQGVVVTANYVNRIENGEIIPESNDLLRGLATILGVSEPELRASLESTQRRSEQERVPPDHEAPDREVVPKLPNQPQEPSLRETAADLGKGAGLVHLFVILLLNGFQAFFLKLTSNPVAFGGEEAATLLQVLFLTFPLTLSLALLISLVPSLTSEGVGYGHLIFAGLLLYAAAWLGNKVGAPIPVVSDMAGGNPITFFVGAMRGYAVAYGPQLFISSFLLGGYIAWAWHFKISPYFNA